MTESYSNNVENNVGKGEIAHYEQFLLFLQCFRKACFQEASKGVIVWEWVNKLKNFRQIKIGSSRRQQFKCSSNDGDCI